MTQPTVLIVPGRGNSEPDHWQSIIENCLPDTRRVQQDDWNTPSLETWSRNIDRAVRALDHRPLVVAHSFGCLAAVHAQNVLGTPFGATLLVTPADPERFALPLWMFAAPLAQPGLLIASDNDPWLSFEKAAALAANWGVRCVNLGPVGHLNVASGHGPWPLGKAIIESMRSELGNLPDNEPGHAEASPNHIGHQPTPVRQIWHSH
ncbi:RBBP9/YdeN family alpha/beta hydrolase [Propionivibrio sp.]|uniref:RBBP9/YdeN family alpha/beta hydrolase n=1 Tax=Propionivibrio sp. TaxID=2212460 RepID=UPI003BF3716A